MQKILARAKTFSIDWKRVRESGDKYDQLLDCNIWKVRKRGHFILVENCAAVYYLLEEEQSEGRVVRNIDIKEIALELCMCHRLHLHSTPHACVIGYTCIAQPMHVS